MCYLLVASCPGNVTKKKKRKKLRSPFIHVHTEGTKLHTHSSSVVWFLTWLTKRFGLCVSCSWRSSSSSTSKERQGGVCLSLSPSPLSLSLSLSPRRWKNAAVIYRLMHACMYVLYIARDMCVAPCSREKEREELKEKKKKNKKKKKSPCRSEFQSPRGFSSPFPPRRSVLWPPQHQRGRWLTYTDRPVIAVVAEDSDGSRPSCQEDVVPIAVACSLAHTPLFFFAILFVRSRVSIIIFRKQIFVTFVHTQNWNCVLQSWFFWSLLLFSSSSLVSFLKATFLSPSLRTDDVVGVVVF